MTKDSHLSIWFFVGILLDLLRVDHHVRGDLRLLRARPRLHLAQYHADFWWGLILLAIGVFYCYHFAPRKINAH